MNVDANVQITELTLYGNDWRYLLVLTGLLLILWISYIFWFFKLQAKAIITDLKEKLYQDRPMAYSVGYKIVTYFNKLFKKEFGCNPRAFTQIQTLSWYFIYLIKSPYISHTNFNF